MATSEIILYGEIGWDIQSANVLRTLKTLGAVEEIDIRINSPGGSVFEGNAILNALRAHPAKITAYIDSVALSMASAIAMVADKIVVAGNGFMMIHNPWVIALGDANELSKTAGRLEEMESGFTKIYAERSGQSVESVSEMMAAETWFNAEQAVEMGFADEIGVASTAEAMASARNFKLLARLEKTPESLRSGGVAALTKERQLIMQAEDQKPAVSQPPTESEPALDEKIVAAERERAVEAERERVATIHSIMRDHRLENSWGDALVESGASVDKAREKALEAMVERDREVAINPHLPRAEITGDGRDRFIEGASQALLARGGIESDDPKNEFRGMSLLDLAKECLEAHGLKTRGVGKMDLVGDSFVNGLRFQMGGHSTSDFPAILSNVANKSLDKGFDEAPETYPIWTVKGSLSDFKYTEAVSLGAFDQLVRLGQGGEYKYGTISEGQTAIRLATWGRMWKITRQAIINDDLGVLTDVPMEMGLAASRTIGSEIYRSYFTEEFTMGDTQALFRRGNTSAGKPPSVEAFKDMLVKMGSHKDKDEKVASLNIRPAFIICPIQLEIDWRGVLGSPNFAPEGGGGAVVWNPLQGMSSLPTVISEARLTGNSWFGLASERTVKLAGMDGPPRPVIESRAGWNTDGLETKVRLDFGTAPMDWRAFFKNPGA